MPVCCSGYYIKVAQISCPPLAPRPPAHDSSGGRCTDGRQSAATRTRFTPALLLTVFLDTDRLYLSLLFKCIFLEARHIVCDICFPTGLQKWWQVILLTPAHIDPCPSTQDQPPIVTQYGKLWKSELREFLPCILITSPHTWAIKAQYLCYQNQVLSAYSCIKSFSGLFS